MILVTLGTQKQQFKRLLDMINSLEVDDKIIVQAGHTKYRTDKMEIIDFISYDKMNEYLKKADLIITHGGTGSIITPLKMGKKVIACARLQKYNEHVDDHQNEIVNVFSEEKYILKLDDNSSLLKIIEASKSFKPKKFVSNNSKFIDKLQIKIKD